MPTLAQRFYSDNLGRKSPSQDLCPDKVRHTIQDGIAFLVAQIYHSSQASRNEVLVSDGVAVSVHAQCPPWSVEIPAVYVSQVIDEANREKPPVYGSYPDVRKPWVSFEGYLIYLRRFSEEPAACSSEPVDPPTYFRQKVFGGLPNPCFRMLSDQANHLISTDPGFFDNIYEQLTAAFCGTDWSITFNRETCMYRIGHFSDS